MYSIYSSDGLWILHAIYFINDRRSMHFKSGSKKKSQLHCHQLRTFENCPHFLKGCQIQAKKESKIRGQYVYSQSIIYRSYYSQKETLLPVEYIESFSSRMYGLKRQQKTIVSARANAKKRLHPLLAYAWKERESFNFSAVLSAYVYTNIHKNISEKVFTVRRLSRLESPSGTQRCAETPCRIDFFLEFVCTGHQRDKRSICVYCQRLLQDSSQVERMSQIKKHPQLIKCARF